MSDRPPLADVLDRFMREKGYTFEKLAEETGLPRNTIYRWLKGKVRKPQTWQPLATVADALSLSKAQTNTLLRAAQHPTIEDLLDRARSDEDKALLSRWTVSTPNNLPGQMTNFIGREEEITSVAESISSSRLVTLTGPGGSGKTRLALKAAEAALDSFPDGVFFVGLAPIVDPDLVIPAILQVFGKREALDEPPIEALKTYLRDKQVLLLLDNFEQVIDASPLLVELLVAALDVKALVTSRTRLHVSGEHELPVPPLASPNTNSTLEELRANDAVTLFAERTRAVKPDFDLTEETTPLAAEICARLDGLPLAIELAAARTRRFTLRTMLDRFPSRLDLSSDGPRDAPGRQQTLRATVSWSYELLRPEEQRLFRRLAAFTGGCSEEAAEAVCKLNGDSEMDASAELDSLIENNLLRPASGVDDESRFEMLETIREYAVELLESSGEAAAIRQRHAEYCLELARAADLAFDGPRQTYWLNRLELERNNFRSALGWCEERGEGIKGLRLCTSVMSLWQLQDYHVEGRRWLESFLTEDYAAPPDLRARAFLWQGLLLMRHAGDSAAAMPMFDKALALYRESGNLSGASETLQAQGDAALNQGDISAARTLYEQSRDVALEGGNAYITSRAYMKIAMCLQEEDDFDEAERCWEQVLRWTRMAGNKARIAQALNGLGEMARHRRDLKRAQDYYQQCLELAKEINSEWCIALALHNLGYIACYKGEYDRAFRLFRESLSLYTKRLTKKGIAECLAGLAKVAASQGKLERSARLCGASKALLDSIGSHLDRPDREDYEHTLSVVRSSLGDERCEALLAEGKAMSLERAIEYATKD